MHRHGIDVLQGILIKKVLYKAAVDRRNAT